MLNFKECSMSYYYNVFSLEKKIRVKITCLTDKKLFYTKTVVLRKYYAGNVFYKIEFRQFLIPEDFVWISIPL